ncbi:MAG TPA: YidB family protein [Rhodanobacteraceae bacterium]|nr:YidB family protein [Rhodanobacteraceae bacterium]
MSILDSLTGGQNTGASSALEIIGGLINHAGGLQGLLNTLQQGGLKNAVESWVSTGANQTISGGQLQQAINGTPLGAHVNEIAQKLGVDPNQVLGSSRSICRLRSTI